MQLADTDIHIWHIKLSTLSCKDFDIFESYLSSAEHEQIFSLNTEARQKFIVVRGFLRRILAYYLNAKPEEVLIKKDMNGKPYLEPFNQSLQFSLSHSRDFVVCAICLKNKIGVDIEAIREIHNYKKIAQRFFSAEEYAELMTLSEQEQIKGFFRLWTKKEAILKAIGIGLFHPCPASQSYAFSIAPLDLDPNYMGTVAVEGKKDQLFLRD